MITADNPPLRRLKLLGFALLLLLAGLGLDVVGGPPRIPAGPPTPEQLRAVLGGSTLPVPALAWLALDSAWVMWLWIVGSLGLESLVVAAEAAATGATWVRGLRRVADRLTLPVARRAVAAAFAVQLLSRGVLPVAAAPLSATELVRAAPADHPASPFGARTFESQLEVATYQVQAGDTLWSIADQAYGSGAAYRRLIDANLGRQMPDGQVFTARGVIQPGWELVVPGANPASDLEAADGQRWYTVQPGDTLSGIAAGMGDRSDWNDLYDLNRGAAGPDGAHVLTDPNTIWPGLRLRLPSTTPDPPDPQPPAEVAALAPDPAVPPEDDLVAASTPATEPPPAGIVAPVSDPTPTPSDPDLADAPDPSQPPLLRTVHVGDPIVLQPVDSAGVATDATGDPDLQAEGSLPSNPPAGQLPVIPLGLGGVGLAAIAGVGIGVRRWRRRRPVSREPESEVVVEDGFAEAQLAHDFARGVHGVGFDPVAALVGQLRQFLGEFNVPDVSVVAVRHGRSATTLTLTAGIAEQPLLVDLAPVFAARLEADVETWVSADRDVLLRLERLRRTRLLPGADASALDAPCLIPLGVLYDRQVYSAAWSSLGHVLVASLPGHGAETILTSLLATLTARRSPQQLRMWLIADPRALPAALLDLPHLERSVDPADDSGLGAVVEDLWAELDRRGGCDQSHDLVVVVPELVCLGEYAASFQLLASRAETLGVHFIAATTNPQDASLSPLLAHFGTRLVLRMQDEEASVALLGVADAAFLGGGGRLLLRLDRREPLELYGYQVASEHLERLVRVMRAAYATQSAEPARPAPTPEPPADAPGGQRPLEREPSVDCLVQTPTPEVRTVDDDPDLGGPPIQVMCFGGPRVLCAGQQVWPRTPTGESKPWEFLLYLACQPAEGVSSEDAVEALWPGDDQADDAPHRFRQLRYRLRRMLAATPGGPPAEGICLDRGTLRLDPGVVSSDAQEFLSLIRAARTSPGPDSLDQLQRARALYTGDLLEGPDARRYAWLDERDDTGVTLREHFRRLFQYASEKVAAGYALAGELDGAVGVYRELTEIDPGDERIWRALFRIHAQRGDRLGLVREERRMRESLRDLAGEVDSANARHIDDPSRETTLEFQRLLASLQDREPKAAAV